MVSPGSPDLETAIAIQARARAASAIRSARQAALSLRPPASMYCCAILPRERQFGEVSYFEVLSRTSITQRLTASLNWVAIASSRESPDEHADINGRSRSSGTRRLLSLIVIFLKGLRGSSPRPVMD